MTNTVFQCWYTDTEVDAYSVHLYMHVYTCTYMYMYTTCHHVYYYDSSFEFRLGEFPCLPKAVNGLHVTGR